jgi:K+-sensing histidine kinase KdpD
MCLRRHVAIGLQAPEALHFNGDQRLLHSAIGNVLGNAVKFTHEGSAIRVRARREEGGLTVEVEDGCGGFASGQYHGVIRALRATGREPHGLRVGAQHRQASARSARRSRVGPKPAR